MKNGSRLMTLGLLLLLVSIGPAQQQGEKKPPKTRYWKEAVDQATVLAATFIGGKGNEWLVSGGFQKDGIVLVGNVLGPTLELPVPVKVIGIDTPPPAEPKPVPVMYQGKPRLTKEGKPIYEPPSWRHEGVTGFILHCSPDLKTVKSAVRLPWAAASICSAAVAPDGSIYIAGKATEAIGRLGGDVAEITQPPVPSQKTTRCSHAFVAKLTADASKVEWVRHSKGGSKAPRVTVAGNEIRYLAQDYRTFDSKGKQLAALAIPGGPSKLTSISPKDGKIVIGGEHHWGTGREPWRCPQLNVHKTTGELETQLYDWGGPYVGLDNCRQVSDTAVRWVTHDKDGNILIYAWSDGGNSVMTTQPNDVRKGVGLKGLGINAAGAGVLSAAYIVRIEPKNFRAIGWTIWLAFGQNGRPNSVWIDSMAQATDGSVCFGGRSAWGLWQSKNRLGDSPPTGEYIAVLSDDTTRVRFCSSLPGTGVTEVDHERSGWGIVAGEQDGKPRVLFVCGSKGEAEHEGATWKTPTHNAMQAQFGGGWSDGYAVLLDLTRSGEVPSATMPSARKPGPTSVSFEKVLESFKPPRKGSVPEEPKEGTVYHFISAYPKWVTVDAEFRARSGDYWPSFFYGKAEQGKLTVTSKGLEANLTLACTAACQPHGDQSRRVMGELIRDGKPARFALTIESLGPVQTVEAKHMEANGKATTWPTTYQVAKAILEVGDKKIPVSPKVRVKYSGAKAGYGGGDHDLPVARLNAYLTVKAEELGLKNVPPQTEIDIRVSGSGTIHDKEPPKPPKKKK